MKNNRKHLMVFIFLITILLVFVPTVSAKNFCDSQPVVHAVLFYSPTCGHCQIVITEVLPPLVEKYGDQLQIIGVNVATVQGQTLYQALIEEWEIPETRLGVPTLVVADTYMVGEGEIPDQFPGIIEKGLETGGIDWPNIPEFSDVLAQTNGTSQEQSTEGKQSSSGTPDDNQTEATVDENSSTTSEANSSTLTIPFDDEISIADRFKMDLSGNILAVVVLVAMLISIVWIFIRIFNPEPSIGTDWSWITPILSIAGLIVAAYLTFVEVTETEAVCGPIGNCNAVQTSPYAKLFGFLPVGILGILGYIGILGSWLLKTIRSIKMERDHNSCNLGDGTVRSNLLNLSHLFGTFCDRCDLHLVHLIGNYYHPPIMGGNRACSTDLDGP